MLFEGEDGDTIESIGADKSADDPADSVKSGPLDDDLVVVNTLPLHTGLKVEPAESGG